MHPAGKPRQRHPQPSEHYHAVSWRLAVLVLERQQRRPQQILVRSSGVTQRVNSTPQPHLTRILSPEGVGRLASARRAPVHLRCASTKIAELGVDAGWSAPQSSAHQEELRITAARRNRPRPRSRPASPCHHHQRRREPNQTTRSTPAQACRRIRLARG
jgi:hypothetical protein